MSQFLKTLLNLPLRIDPAMPEDEIRLETSTQIVRIVNVGKAIEPTSYDSPSLRRRREQAGPMAGVVDQVITSEGREERFRTPVWHPDREMRRQGYTRNPAICVHERKRMSSATMQWRCRDCGTDL